MTVNQLRAVLYGRFEMYWEGAEIVWGAADRVKPSSPLIVLRLGTVTRTGQPITQTINGVRFSAYPSGVTLQVDLLTEGNAVEIDGETYYENTATSDMLDFVNFLDSPATVMWSNTKEVSIALIGGVHDISEVVNDSQWQYRAMAEFGISFTQWTAEHNGVLSENCIIFDVDGLPTGVDVSKWEQTASGGGTEALAGATTGYIEEITLDFVNEQEDTDNE